MYRGFQLNLKKGSLKENLSISEFIKRVKMYADQRKVVAINKENKSIVRETLRDFFLSDGSIDGSKMQENWFPQIKADVFISHSHQDEKLALGLAGWLYEEFGLKAFIDSAVWKYSQYLEDMLLDSYGEHSSLHNYDELKNFVSAHVHMMLSVALNQMIDNTECLFFINTPNSISLNAPIDETTPSPWIYSEIAMSRLIRRREPSEHREPTRVPLNESYSAELPIRYTLLMDHLEKLTLKDLQEWESDCQNNSSHSIKALDSLYKLKPVNKR